MPPPSLNKIIHFGPHTVTSQVFHTTPLSYTLVNLRPLLPGHILVCPLRRVQHMTELRSNEVCDLFLTVQKVSRTLKRVYGASALNVAVQDGEAAGQSVPHVHVHVIPRKEGDMDSKGGGDKIYEMLEGEEGDVGSHLRQHKQHEERQGKFPMPDAGRKDRSQEEMRQEAEWLSTEMEKDAKDDTS